MTKIIVAIGGGENGRIKSDGTKYPYETESIDQEIVKLTGKEKPHFLMLAHSQLQSLDAQDFYFKTMENIYGKRFNCECKLLRSDKLNDHEYVNGLIDWADIIYEGGGNTLDMIELWKTSGFDETLRNAWESGKVLCGVSAGANCWFEACSSDSLKYKEGSDHGLIAMDCLGFLKGFFVPHADQEERKESVKNMLKETDMIGLLFSNCAALEIVDDQYRVLTSEPKYYNIKPFALKTYWYDGKYYEEEITISSEFHPIDEIYKKR